ncbi:MAG: helix-turn-helix transcriptional regulator [Myxococcales bacterium]|nr:helix-turn-helix transcriptional regulator [Myxococcales bacterium]
MTKREPSTPTYFDSRTFDIALARTGLRTATALADAAGVSRSRIYIVRAGYKPPESLQMRIAEALGVDVDDLWRPIDFGDAE